PSLPWWSGLSLSVKSHGGHFTRSSFSRQYRQKSVLKGNFQSKLKLAWRTEREYARARSDAIRGPIRSRGPVDRTCSAVQHTAQTIARAIEICEVEDIKRGHARFQHQPVAYTERSRQSQIKRSQPSQAHISRRSGLNGWRIRS